ncbi:MAG: glycine zipper 2TM domain-containing protein [Bosea sp. (in: a-proteobacteria)]
MTTRFSAFRIALLTGAVLAALPFANSAHAQSGSLLSGQNIGMVGGAVAGGVAGKQLVGKKNRTLGIAAGAVGGGALGAVAGNMYDNSGKSKAAPARREPTTTGSVGKGGSMINGTTVGVVAGAVGGGVLGNKMAGKKNKTLGTVGGVVGGGLVGGAVGSMLSR